MVDGILEGLDRREPAALARAISLVENQRDGFERVLSHAHARVGRGGTARRIGITGPPGAGKSTLTERLIQHFRGRGLSVGVVAVDPTSPFTGGALLGDRIRMESATLDPHVFIRSMATRGAHGGLATTTEEVADLLEAFGFERILVETVGVGQTELDIARSAETTVLVLVPESGDAIQTLKAGVMEIADIYVVNKSDRPGAEKLRQEIEVMLGIRRGNAFRHIAPRHAPRPAKAVEGGEWEAAVLGTVASQGEGITSSPRPWIAITHTSRRADCWPSGAGSGSRRGPGRCSSAACDAGSARRRAPTSCWRAGSTTWRRAERARTMWRPRSWARSR